MSFQIFPIDGMEYRRSEILIKYAINNDEFVSVFMKKGLLMGIMFPPFDKKYYDSLLTNFSFDLVNIFSRTVIEYTSEFNNIPIRNVIIPDGKIIICSGESILLSVPINGKIKF